MEGMRHKQKLTLNNVRYVKLNNHDRQWKLSTHDPTEQKCSTNGTLKPSQPINHSENLNFCIKILTLFFRLWVSHTNLHSTKISKLKDFYLCLLIFWWGHGLESKRQGSQKTTKAVQTECTYKPLDGRKDHRGVRENKTKA